MPELPEVEILVRHLAPLLKNRTIREVEVRRPRIARPTSQAELSLALAGTKFISTTRRGKYLLFNLRRSTDQNALTLLGHLGMTGRMYLQKAAAPIPKHAAVVLQLDRDRFIFEDTRYFGRMTLDLSSVNALGPEPFSHEFTPTALLAALKTSRQPIKVKLLDQSVVAGVGNIYASEALFLAQISPRLAAHRLTQKQSERLHQSIRAVLQEAIDCGSTIPLDWAGTGKRNGLFYYGQVEGNSAYYEEHLRVYDRHGQPCLRCRTTIKRLVQAARSTYYCPRCQRT